MTPATYVRTALVAGFALLAMLGLPLPASAPWVLQVAAVAIVTLAATLNVLGAVPSMGKVRRLRWGFYFALCPILILHLLAVDRMIAEFGVWVFAGSSTLAAAARAALTLSLIGVLQASLWAASEHLAGDMPGGKHKLDAAAATSVPPTTHKAERASQAAAETRASGTGVADRPRPDRSSPASNAKVPINDRASTGCGIVGSKGRMANDIVNTRAAQSTSPGVAQCRRDLSAPAASAAGVDPSARPGLTSTRRRAHRPLAWRQMGAPARGERRDDLGGGRRRLHPLGRARAPGPSRELHTASVRSCGYCRPDPSQRAKDLDSLHPRRSRFDVGIHWADLWHRTTAAWTCRART
jgi:hypothetical protein